MIAFLLRMLTVVLFSKLLVSAMPKDECFTTADCMPGQLCTIAFGHNVCYDFPLFMGRRKRSTIPEEKARCKDGICESQPPCRDRICNAADPQAP
ncbi:unnamed protein product, partial [Mesorhabditis belari]|uniref:Uncharacterized protein n=1 Tax=Mesorhabditis belari TaxID=2138241 RepID=A0AAF3F562_9BILA